MIEKLFVSVQQMKKIGNGNWSYLYKINKLLVNLIYPIIQRFNKTTGCNPDSDVVVSLTTYPARIKTVWCTVASLLNQTYKPFKVLLYLSKEQFPEGIESLPKNLTRLQNRGLEIVFVEGDLKPHKKYYYALKEYTDYMVITADDDIFYPENHIEFFVKASHRFPDAVICTRSHMVTMEDAESRRFAPYNSWDEQLTSEPNYVTMPVGCNGALYKRRFFDDELFDKDKIMELSLYTDDLWLKIMELKNGTKAFNCAVEPLIYFDNIFNKNTGLWHTNASETENRNDVVWNKLADVYPEAIKRIN